MFWACEMYVRCECPTCKEHLEDGRTADDVSPLSHELGDECPWQRHDTRDDPNMWIMLRRDFKQHFKSQGWVFSGSRVYWPGHEPASRAAKGGE